MLRSATQVVRMPCVCHMYVCVYVCVCVEIFFPTNPYLQAGLTDLDEIWHDGRSYGVASPKNFGELWPTFWGAQIFDRGYLRHFLMIATKFCLVGGFVG